LNNNQYLATITDANNVLSNHHFDNNKSNKTKKTDKKLKSDNNVKKEEQEVPLLFAQLEEKCYCCRKPGHKLPQYCEKDSKPHEEWFIHKAESHMQASGNADATSEGSNKSNDTESNQGTSTRRVKMGQSLYEEPTVISSRCYAWMHSTGQLFQYDDLEQPRHGFHYS
jgi:hypothetical protein